MGGKGQWQLRSGFACVPAAPLLPAVRRTAQISAPISSYPPAPAPAAGPLPAQLLPQVLPGASALAAALSAMHTARGSWRDALSVTCRDHAVLLRVYRLATSLLQDVVNKSKKKACPSCRHEFGAKFAANPRINTALTVAIRAFKAGDARPSNKTFVRCARFGPAVADRCARATCS